jgi:hypothetical protein
MDLKEAKYKKSNQRHPWELARLNIVNKIGSDTLISLNNKEGLLLDVGCGDTWFIEQLSQQYPKLYVAAIDILFTDDDLKTLREKYHGSRISVYRTMDEAQADLGSKRAGMVLLLDVIEHIEDDIKFLDWLQTFPSIDNETIFTITVPAYQWLFSKHDVFLEHYRRYDNALLKTNINKAGLKPLKIGYFFFSLYLARIAAWAKEKISNDKTPTTGLAEWDKSASVTSLIKNILLSDFAVTSSLHKIGIKLPGLSNYILCKKSA